MKGVLTALGGAALCLALVIVILIGLVSGGGFTSWFGGTGNAGVVTAALEMAPHLYNGPPDGLDTWYDSSFPQAALNFWQKTCPGCSSWANGNLQCVMFVVAAYALAGHPLPAIGNAIDFWSLYHNRPGWIEVPSGTGPPLPGDMIVLSSPYFEGVGHIAIVTSVQMPTGGKDGSITIAQANGPGAINSFPLPASLVVSTWTNYTTLGFIRPTSAGNPTMPTGMPNSPYVQIAWQGAQQAGIRPDYFVRQIRQESGFNPSAVSPAGAEGIAQFMPTTAAGLGIDPWNPDQSLAAAANMMAGYAQQYSGDYQKALAAYNAGPGSVQSAVNTCGSRWLSCMPTETQTYVSVIMSQS